MKVLIFGNSDTDGLMVDGKTWPQAACDALESETGTTVELIARSFVPIGAGAAQYAQRIAEEASPDVAVLPLSDFAFLVGLVEEKVRHLLGNRAARIYKRIERRFGSATAVHSRTNVVGRSLARRLIGARPLTSAEEATETYLAVLRRLASREQLQVIVVSYPVSSTFHSSSNKQRRDRAQFYDQLRAAAEEHHFHWLDGEATASARRLGSGVGGDSTHLTDVQHRAMGAALGRILAANHDGRALSKPVRT